MPVTTDQIQTEPGSSSRARDPSQNSAPSNVDLNDFGSAIEHGIAVPTSMSNSYYPPFPEQADLSAPLIDYQYPLLDPPMDFGYLLSAGPTDGPLAGGSRLDEASLTLPTSFPDSISDALNPAPPAQSMQSRSNESHATSSQQATAPSYGSSGQTSGHAHTMLPPILHPDPSDSDSKYGSDVSIKHIFNRTFPLMVCC